jgi:nitroreductase
MVINFDKHVVVKADPIFYKRQSPRNFLNQDVRVEDLMTLFEAARWAASSFNEQPWRFIFAFKEANSKLYKQLFSCLNQQNQEWAKDAPVLILTLAKTTFSESGKSNRHAWHDVGLAMGNFCIQATKMNLIVHQMAGFSPKQASETFNLTNELEPVAMVAVGYPEEKKTDRERKPLKALFLNSPLPSS